MFATTNVTLEGPNTKDPTGDNNTPKQKPKDGVGSQPTTMASAREAAGLKQVLVDKKGNYFEPIRDGKFIHLGRTYNGDGTSPKEKEVAAKVAKAKAEATASKEAARKAEIAAAVEKALKEAEANQPPAEESSCFGSMLSYIGNFFQSIGNGLMWLLCCCGLCDGPADASDASDDQTEAQSAAK